MQKRPGAGAVSASLGRAAAAGVADENRIALTRPARTTYLTKRLMRRARARHGCVRISHVGVTTVVRSAARRAGAGMLRVPHAVRSGLRHGQHVARRLG